jgi:hypothetical protein
MGDYDSIVDTQGWTQWSRVGNSRVKNCVSLKEVFWNTRGLDKTGRFTNLAHLIRSNNLDFIGVMETKNFF